ncbi:hypothetical protein [Endozoicomonas sp. Mp262]|uniref:hypothetical protein n=1 Tax=Endozoicomonas sp. Mp262 TaxID=2919499 RepID=UPI0021DB23CC
MKSESNNLIFGSVSSEVFPCIEKQQFKAFAGRLGETVNLQGKDGVNTPYHPTCPVPQNYLAEIKVYHTTNSINVAINPVSLPTLSKQEAVNDCKSISMSNGSGRRLIGIAPETTTPNVCMCDYPKVIAESLRDAPVITSNVKYCQICRQYTKELVKFEEKPVTLSMLVDTPYCLIDVGYPESHLAIFYGEQQLSRLDENGATFFVEEQMIGITDEEGGLVLRILLYLSKALFGTSIDKGVYIIKSSFKEAGKKNQRCKNMLLYKAYSQAEKRDIFEVALLNGKWLYAFSLKNNQNRYTSYWRVDSDSQ